MRKPIPILYPNEICWKDLLFYLLKNCWIILLITLASGVTVWSVKSASLSASYTAKATLSVNVGTAYEKWTEQIEASSAAAQKAAEALNTAIASLGIEKPFGEDFHAVLTAQPVQQTNLIELSASASSPDEAYLYLTELLSRKNELPALAGLDNILIEAVSTPTMPAAQINISAVITAAAKAAVAAAVLSSLAMALIWIAEGNLTTYQAAKRLLALPTVGGWHKGKSGSGFDSALPLLTDEKAIGVYVDEISKSALHLRDSVRAKENSSLWIRPIIDDAKGKKHERSIREADRIGLNLALALAADGMPVCFIDRAGEALECIYSELLKADDSRLNASIQSEGRLTIGNLTVCQPSDTEWIKSKAFKWVIFTGDFMPDELKKRVHGKSEADRWTVKTLWTVPSGKMMIKTVNRLSTAAILKENEAETSIGILLYDLHTAAKPADEETLADEEAHEVDLIRWMIAFLKVSWRIKWKWLTALVLASIAALTVSFAAKSDHYQLNTAFSLASSEIALQPVKQLTSEQNDTSVFNPQADVEDSGAVLSLALEQGDLTQLALTLPAVWNSQAIKDVIQDRLGWTDLSETVSVIAGSDGLHYTLSVVGSDREQVKQVTETFFDIQGIVLTQTAGEVKLNVESSSVVLVKMSELMPWTAVSWLLVILIGIVYALLVSFRDSTVILPYEAQACLGCPVIGRLALSGRELKSNGIETDSITDKRLNDVIGLADAGLARLAHQWAAESEGKIVLITSALRMEGSAALAGMLGTLLKQNGRSVAVADISASRAFSISSKEEAKAVLASLKGNADFLLINCSMTIAEAASALLSEQADVILWTVRIGYTDKKRITMVKEHMRAPEKTIGCVMTGGWISG